MKTIKLFTFLLLFTQILSGQENTGSHGSYPVSEEAFLNLLNDYRLQHNLKQLAFSEAAYFYAENLCNFLAVDTQLITIEMLVPGNITKFIVDREEKMPYHFEIVDKYILSGVYQDTPRLADSIFHELLSLKGARAILLHPDGESCAVSIKKKVVPYFGNKAMEYLVTLTIFGGEQKFEENQIIVDSLPYSGNIFISDVTQSFRDRFFFVISRLKEQKDTIRLFTSSVKTSLPYPNAYFILPFDPTDRWKGSESDSGELSYVTCALNQDSVHVHLYLFLDFDYGLQIEIEDKKKSYVFYINAMYSRLNDPYIIHDFCEDYYIIKSSTIRY